MKNTTPYPTPSVSLHEARIDAYERAIDLFESHTLRYFEHMTRDFHLAEDLSQELWLTIYKRFKTSQFFELGLIMRKAYQVFIDNARKRNVRSFVILSSSPPEAISPPVFAEAFTEEEIQHLKQYWWDMYPCIDLTDTQKDVFWLKEYHGYTIQEISEILHVPTSTAHDWLNSAKRKCAAYMKQYTP